jgi:signal transduction histidine kinase
MTTLIVVIALVVGMITYAMASLFHNDKTTYIYDLTSIIAQHVVEEAHALHTGYKERLLLFSRIMLDPNLPQAEKSTLLGELFEDIGEFVSVTLYEDGQEQVTVYDAKSLERAQLLKSDVISYRQKYPLPFDRIKDQSIYVVNSTITKELPSMTIAVAIEGDDIPKNTIVAAMVRLDSMLDIVSRSDVYDAFIIDSNGMVLAHNDIARVVENREVDWIPSDAMKKVGAINANTSPTITLEYTTLEGIDVVAGFAQSRTDFLTAGVHIPRSAAYLTAREFLVNLAWVALLLLIFAAMLGFFWAKRITRPIERLSEVTKVVGAGNFDVDIDVESNDEIGELAGSFRHMALGLHERDEELKTAQYALVQSEKLAAFGKLGAGIAHEVKNPLAGILGYAQLSLRKADKESGLYKNLKIIEKETKRCSLIIENLLKFSRKEEFNKESTNINDVINNTMEIVNHQLTINQVALNSELADELQPIYADANQIQQVLMNFCINAQQALDGNPGEVKISTRQLDNESIEIKVCDTGPGISPEIQEKIFEPFFTTKPPGQGTGLGLSVTFGIIRDHQGDISIKSKIGEGTCFIVTLPTMSSNKVAAIIKKEQDHN